MSYTFMWTLACDLCGHRVSGHDGAKYITLGDRLEFDRLYEENGFIERPDGLLQCEKHPRPVA